jgi:hypothetical protein
MRAARIAAGTVLTASLLGLSAGTAVAQPAAEVQPSRVAPGATVTVFVSCDPVRNPPKTITANSQAFARGAATLTLVPDNDPVAGPAYSGKARIAPRRNFTPAGRVSKWGIDGTCPDGKQWKTTVTVDLGLPSKGARAGEGGSVGGMNTTGIAAGGALLAVTTGAGIHLIRRRSAEARR